MSWQIRAFAPMADREAVERLWAAAMPPAWPVLPAGIGQLRGGLVAETAGGLAGFVAVDMAGSIPLILVAPACQRQQLGTALLTAALAGLRAAGVTDVTAGSGGTFYIWPGVPQDLPGACRFFASRGWQRTHDTLDLVTDLRQYRPPPGAFEKVARDGITIAPPGSAGLADVLAFETAEFPEWSHWFTGSGPASMLAARDGAGRIAATLLMDGPGASGVLTPVLGPAAGTIGCVGVTELRQGQGIGTALVARASEILRDAGTRNCHIGWATRESFYNHVGYRPWRRYSMFTAPA
ncbi:MAG TPA: GNAT family N-acetyltransferase [Streptosporangiaceae bacterium]|nr:GNAT family N-acetyltransferase [Streptosporangiaceae bacterium]